MKFSSFVKKRDKISSYLDEKEYTFFFKYENKIYAATEESRLIFAKIKNEDEDLPSDWKNELKFSAIDLIKSLTEDIGARFFGYNNLKNIKNIDRETIIKKLSKLS